MASLSAPSWQLRAAEILRAYETGIRSPEGFRVADVAREAGVARATFWRCRALRERASRLVELRIHRPGERARSRRTGRQYKEQLRIALEQRDQLALKLLHGSMKLIELGIDPCRIFAGGAEVPEVPGNTEDG